MLRLVVHADDLGLSVPVNEGIAAAHREGIVTSASLMANGAAFAHAVALCRDTPTLDVGVHLVLVAERPLLPAARVPSLVDAAGRLPAHATVFARRHLRGAIRLDEVRAELVAQVERVLEAGLRPSHLDSHQHVHALPAVGRIVHELARHYGIPLVRRPVERIRAYMLWPPAGWPRVAQAVALGALAARGPGDGVSAPVRFAGFHEGGRLDAARLRRVIEHLPREGSCELMCHPGRDDPASPYGAWGYRWGAELAALVDPALRALVKARGIRLVSFRDLAPAPAPR